MKFFSAGDINSSVIAYYFGGHSASVTSSRHPRSGSIRSVLSQMPPNILSVSLKIGSWSTGSEYGRDPAIAEFFNAFDTQGVPPLLPNPVSVFSNIEKSIIMQAFTEQFPGQAVDPAAVQALVTRPGRIRIILVYSGGYKVTEKMDDRNFFVPDASIVQGIVHLDSLYGNADRDILRIARDTNIKCAAAHNDSASDPEEFHRDLNAAGGVSIHTDSSHSSIPGEFAGMLTNRLLMMMMGQTSPPTVA